MRQNFGPSYVIAVRRRALVTLQLQTGSIDNINRRCMLGVTIT